MAHQGCHAFCSSGIGHMTESMPSRLTPRSRNGTTVVVGRSLPSARPHAATPGAETVGHHVVIPSIISPKRIQLFPFQRAS
jgi:hypothetical protein